MSGVIFPLASLLTFFVFLISASNQIMPHDLCCFLDRLHPGVVITATIISQTKSNVRTSLMLPQPARFLAHQMPSTKWTCAADKIVQMVG